MNKSKRNKKVLLLTLALSAGLLLPLDMNAQKGGMFARGNKTESTDNFSMMNRGSTGGYDLHNQQFGSNTIGGYDLHNQTFGQEAPLGSGLLILAAAGAGYALKKRKKNNK